MERFCNPIVYFLFSQVIQASELRPAWDERGRLHIQWQLLPGWVCLTPQHAHRHERRDHGSAGEAGKAEEARCGTYAVAQPASTDLGGGSYRFDHDPMHLRRDGS